MLDQKQGLLLWFNNLHSGDPALADDAAAFAAAVTGLYNDAPRWQQLSAAGQDNIRRHFSLEAARSTVAEVFLPA